MAMMQDTNPPNLWTSPFSFSIEDMLHFVDVVTVKALADTACSNNVVGMNHEDNIEIILRYTENLDKFLSYQRLTNNILRNYLFKKECSIQQKDGRKELIVKVKGYLEQNEGGNIRPKSLWDTSDAKYVREFLKSLDNSIVKDLANTACNNRMTGKTPKDDIGIILRCTENLDKIFSNERITCEVLQNYVYKKLELPISVKDTRSEMIETIIQVWRGRAGVAVLDKFAALHTSFNQ